KAPSNRGLFLFDADRSGQRNSGARHRLNCGAVVKSRDNSPVVKLPLPLGTRRPRGVLAVGSPLPCGEPLMSPGRTTRFPLLVTPPLRHLMVMCAAATFCLGTPASRGQAGPGASAPPTAPQYPAPIDPQTVSCSALKDQLKSVGNLYILVCADGRVP